MSLVKTLLSVGSSANVARHLVRMMRHSARSGQLGEQSVKPSPHLGQPILASPKTRNKLFRCVFMLDQWSASSVMPSDNTHTDALFLPHCLNLSANSISTLRAQFQQIKSPLYLRLEPRQLSDQLFVDFVAEFHAKIDGFVVHVSTKNQLVLCDALLSEMEREAKLVDGYFSFITVLTSSPDLRQWTDIVQASDRNVAVMLSENTLEETVLTHPTNNALKYLYDTRLVMAARSAGLSPIYGLSYRTQPNAFRKQSHFIKEMGYDGRIALDKIQSIINQDVFSVTHSERQRLQAINAVVQTGIGVIRRSDQESRQMIGPPHRKAAQILTAKIQSGAVCLQRSGSGVPVKVHPVLVGALQVKLGVEQKSPMIFNLDSGNIALWLSSCPMYQALTSSDHSAQMYGFQERLIPSTLLYCLAASLTTYTLSRFGRAHLGGYKAVQHKAVYRGDSLSCSSVITRINQLKSQNSVVYSTHYLRNQRDEVVYSFQKRSLFDTSRIQCDHAITDHTLTQSAERDMTHESELRHMIIGSEVNTLETATGQRLMDGQIIVHKGHKSYNRSEVKCLSVMMRATNEHHLNVCRYLDEDILVPGPVVIAGTLSNTGPELGEILYEEWLTANNTNKVNHTDIITSLSYVRQRKEIRENPDLEELVIKTFGVINVDPSELESCLLTDELLNNDDLKPSQIEEELLKTCPQLWHKISSVIVRQLVRAKPTPH